MSIPCLHQKVAKKEYLTKKEGKRRCPNDSESSTKIMKMDMDASSNIIDNCRDTDVTNLAFSNCNGVQHFTETIETISNCMDMSNLSVGSETVTKEGLSEASQTVSTLDVGNGNKIIPTGDGCLDASEKQNSRFNSHDVLVETSNDIEVSMDIAETISTVDVHSQNICNGFEEPLETVNITSCPHVKLKSQQTHSNSYSNEIVESLKSDAKSCRDRILSAYKTSDNTLCYNGIQEKQETNNVVLTSNGESTVIDIPVVGIGSDDNTASVNRGEITPSTMHKYLGNIFEFDVLCGEQSVPVLSFECPEQAEYLEDITVEKKLITEGKTNFQILNEYCQKELKALPSASKIERHSLHDFTILCIVYCVSYLMFVLCIVYLYCVSVLCI